MASFLKKISLMPKGLKYKTLIAFSLTSLIPLLICVWLATTYIFPNINLFLDLSLGNISLILVISLFISMLGFYITKQMIDPIVKMAEDAKEMAEGDMNKVIEIDHEDEIGDLGTSLNIMTQKIKDNIDRLKKYGEQTKLINIEINKKVLTLSSLLQIGNLISSSKDLATILDFIAQKISDVEDDSGSFVMLFDEESNSIKLVSRCNIEEEEILGLDIQASLLPTHIVLVDKNTPSKQESIRRLLEELGLNNIAILPITVSKKVYGMLCVFNKRKDFIFKDDTRDLLRIFVKQAAIAVENDLLIKKARKLAVKDELTRLYNESYIHARLDEEIKRAVMYQRPCGYLLIDVDGFKDFHKQSGEGKAEMLLKASGEIFKGAVTEVDKVGRLTADRFAIVLPERNKKQSANIAEEIRKRVESNLARTIGASSQLTVSIGVSENPIDGSSADELMQKADELIKKAKSLGKNRVAV